MRRALQAGRPATLDRAATTVDAYLAALPPERRAVMSEVRDRIGRHLPEGYVEVMTWGMPTYELAR